MPVCRTVVVYLVDNDYGGTFKNLLETVCRLLSYRSDLSESELRALILDSIEWHYRAFQAAPGQSAAEIGRVVQYLRGGVKVYFDEAAEAMTLKDCDHGSWVLHVDSGQISAF